ncbi:MAG TPA: dethiobiotin synthase [Acidimicrobiales bacterium]|nr:dethiobiotin synthase [Acidimicrobiales bacterium]
MKVVVAGTGTDVGKTWLAAQLAPLLGATAWKPAQSFVPGNGLTDAEVLAAATGQSPHEVCPPHRWYPVPLAPPEAADELGQPPFTLADLVAEQPTADALLVEGAGGVRSPLASDGDTVALVEAVRPDVTVLVAHGGLGAINDVRLSAGVLPGPVVVFLNRYDDNDLACRRNLVYLRRDGFEVAVDVADLERLLHVRV